MKINSIRFTLISAFIILFFIVGGVTLFFFWHWAKEYLEGRLQDRLLTQGKLTKQFIEYNLNKEETFVESTQNAWQSIGNSNFNIKVGDISGFIIFDSNIKGKPGGKLSNDSLKAAAWMETYWNKTENGENFIYLALPISRFEQITGVLELSISLSETQKILSSFKRFLWQALLGGLGIGIIGVFAFIQWLTRPIQNLTNVANSIAAGNLEMRAAGIYRNDELGILARSVNEMADKLTGQLENLENERSGMRALLATLMDGVIALNNELQVIFLNPAAERALRISNKDALLTSLNEIWPNQEVLTWVKENIHKRSPTSTDLNLTHNALRLFLLPVIEIPGKPESIMLLFRDMTEARHFEDMRSQFIGHVSHELRTPLTIIKGNVVTLLDEPAIGDNPTFRRLLQRMEDEAERLAGMVEELLDYTRLKSSRVPLSLTPILLSDIVLEVCDSFRDHAARYGVTIEVELPGTILPILGDPGRIRQILLNLLDNALKFSPQGTPIRVAVSRQGLKEASLILLSVKDSGPGIPPKDLPHIFEHFYQIKDHKGHSTALDKGVTAKNETISQHITSQRRGWGLGLAIVKELAELHRAKATVESHLGAGTMITIAFPAMATTIRS